MNDEAMFSLLFGNRAWKRLLPSGQSRPTLAVFCGTAYSILPVVIFGSLFMGADPVFPSLTLRFFWLSPMHFVVTAIIAFGAGGYLRRRFRPQTPGPLRAGERFA
jgi:hypothetical protein